MGAPFGSEFPLNCLAIGVSMRYLKLIGLGASLAASTVTAQVNDHWFFGHNTRLDFSGGAVTAGTGVLDALEGTATVSDQTGDLLFYTEGTTVWDANHNVMPNGTGLLGGASSTQAALIVPKPGACGVYYVFTTQDHFQSGDLRYSIVDMCLNSGLGDVVVGSKNIMINTFCGEKLTAVPRSDGGGYWIISHGLDNNTFYAYALTSNGLQMTPVASSVGSIHQSNCLIGPLKASHDGTRLVSLATFCNKAEFFDFDAMTGAVSNPVNLISQYGISGNCYGAEFSPDDNLLYISTTWVSNKLYQLDLSSSSSTMIATGSPGGYYFGALQLGPDGRIYMARKDEAFLDVINSPDVPGAGCAYDPAGLSLAAGTTCDIGMPNMVPATVMQALPTSVFVDLGMDTSICYGPVPLVPTSSCADSFLWQDGSTGSTFTVTAPGTYWVRIMNACGTGSDTVQIGNTSPEVVDLGPDTAICTGSTLLLSVPSWFDSALWQDGSSFDQFTVVTPGSYAVDVVVNGCMDHDTIVVVGIPLPQAGFTFAVDTCARTVSFMDGSQEATELEWNLDDNATSTEADPQHIYSSSGTWSVALTAHNSCGSDSTAQLIELPDIGQVSLSGPDSLCNGTLDEYTASLTGAVAINSNWSNGAADTLATTFGPGADPWIGIQVTTELGCSLSDSMFIHVLPLPTAQFSWESQDCGTQVQFTDESNNAIGHAWDLGNGIQSQDPDPMASYVPPGPFTVVLVVSNACGNDTATAVLDLAPQGNLALTGPNSLCESDTALYTAAFSGGVIASITWSTGEIGLTGLGFSTISDTTLTVEVVGMDACVYADSIGISMEELPIAGFAWSAHACDSTVTFTSAALGASTLQWDLGSGQSSALVEPIGQYPGSGTYPVQLIAANACGSDTSVQQVVLGDPDQLSIGGPTWICSAEPATFVAALGNSAITSILWSNGDTVPAIAITMDVDQTITATAFDAAGCQYSASATIAVIGADDASFAYVPNVFTPNGDGRNETFAPVLVDPGAALEMLIFNRWGQEIYSATAGQPWDGRFQGDPVPDGVYVYLIRWRDRCKGAMQERHGCVSLLR